MRSAPFNPAALTRTRSSPPPGLGSGWSRTTTAPSTIVAARTRERGLAGTAGAVRVASGEDRGVAHDVTGLRRMDHLAAADVEAVVVEIAAEHDDVAGLELRQRHVREVAVLRAGGMGHRDAARAPCPCHEPRA